MKTIRSHLTVFSAFFFFVACSADERGNAGASSGETAGADGFADQLGVVDPGWIVPEELQLCDGGPCQCANGVDDDGDGMADGFDMECTGPLDNDEGTFATGIPGDNRDPKWQDCFFDGDSGAGNDGCRYSTDCLTGALDQGHPDCRVTDQCIAFCEPRTPSGCDCFGCCTIRRQDGSAVNVIIGGDCDETNLDLCQQCVPTDACDNECGECELCPGKTVADLPDHCWSETPPSDGGSSSGGTPFACDNGAQQCPSTASCPTGYYCLQGCCIEIVE